MGKLSRTKGFAFERWVAQKLRHIFPEARRHLEYQDAECFGVDLVNTGRYFFQCKRGRKWSSISAIEEIRHEAAFGEVPVLVTQGDHKEAMAVLPFDALVRLLENSDNAG